MKNYSQEKHLKSKTLKKEKKKKGLENALQNQVYASSTLILMYSMVN